MCLEGQFCGVAETLPVSGPPPQPLEKPGIPLSWWLHRSPVECICVYVCACVFRATGCMHLGTQDKQWARRDTVAEPVAPNPTAPNPLVPDPMAPEPAALVADPLPFCLLGAVPAAHGCAHVRPPGGPAHIPCQQRVLTGQRRADAQPLCTKQHLILVRGARTPQHGHLHWPHGPGKARVPSASPCATRASLHIS